MSQEQGMSAPAPESYEGWMFIDCGEVDGVRYVDVLDAEGNPWEYAITLTAAIVAYGPHPVQDISELYE